MRKVLGSLVAVLTAPVLAGGAELELAGYAGYTFPFYSQTITYDSGPVNIPIPGVDIDQGGEFELKGSGGGAFAGGITLYATEGFGFELRLDSASMDVDTLSNTYSVGVDLPAPLDPVSADLELDEAKADLKALTPWSFNVKLRSGGESLRFTASGGFSRLGSVELASEQTAALGVVAVNLETSELEIATLPLRARTGEEPESSWGGNLGVGIQIGLGERGALVLEARGFYFPERAIAWEAEDEGTLPAIQEALLDRLLDRIDPIKLKPWWAQATIGVAIRF